MPLSKKFQSIRYLLVGLRLRAKAHESAYLTDNSSGNSGFKSPSRIFHIRQRFINFTKTSKFAAAAPPTVDNI